MAPTTARLVNPEYSEVNMKKTNTGARRMSSRSRALEPSAAETAKVIELGTRRAAASAARSLIGSHAHRIEVNTVLLHEYLEKREELARKALDDAAGDEQRAARLLNVSVATLRQALRSRGALVMLFGDEHEYAAFMQRMYGGPDDAR